MNKTVFMPLALPLSPPHFSLSLSLAHFLIYGKSKTNNKDMCVTCLNIYSVFNNLCLDISSKLPTVRDGAFSEMSGSRVCDAGIHSPC